MSHSATSLPSSASCDNPTPLDIAQHPDPEDFNEPSANAISPRRKWKKLARKRSWHWGLHHELSPTTVLKKSCDSMHGTFLPLPPICKSIYTITYHGLGIPSPETPRHAVACSSTVNHPGAKLAVGMYAVIVAVLGCSRRRD